MDSQLTNGKNRLFDFGNVEVIGDLDKNSFGSVDSRENRGRGIEVSEYR